MDRLFPDCAFEGTEWAFRATSMINKQNARIAELERQLAELREVIVHVYNSGYHAGHHYTVEGGYADIHSQDMDTYQADVVCELIEDLIGSQARAEVERVLEGDSMNIGRSEGEALKEENKTLRSRVAMLEESLRRGVELHENYDADTCMCGESMWHALADHKPTATLQYYGDQWAEEARRVLEGK